MVGSESRTREGRRQAVRAKAVFLLLGVSVIAFVWTQPSPGKMSSPSYEVITEVLDNGGSTSSSATKLNTAAIGQSTPVVTGRGHP